MKASYIALIAVLLLLLAEQKQVSAAVNCNLMELAPCSSAMTSATVAPSGVCCKKIKEQSPCLCKYLKDPRLKNFVSSPNAKKVAAACKTGVPAC